MTALSDRIAAEHTLYRCTESRGTGVYGQPVEVYVGYQCECGWTTKDSAATSHHIADVTERAVRDTIAQQLEEGRQAIHDTWVAAHLRLTTIPSAVCDAYTQAARIARGETTP